ncbi:MAG TPA: carboxypeptidase-like regulatory domain-containing protein [Prolixibacteraceae bacterium]|nr:carboxypeptidase-like regulatory domain-containing protein [Prolixibacteraceae bacterium]
MNRLYLLTSILFVVLFVSKLPAQTSNATLYGIVSDEEGNPIEMVNVALKNYPFGTSTNRKGEFLLRIPSGREIIVGFSSMGYTIHEKTFIFKADDNAQYNVTLISNYTELDEVVVSGQTQTSGNIVRINPRAADRLPDVGVGTIEGVLKTLPGVTSSNELSSQYSVRGGSFDENLVYVNDIEVYRPYLVRSGQQEGLSFVNSDMVSSIEFSAGGFDAKYGDKMSSVLDIKYHRPREFSASASISLLGGKAHAEDISKNKKFTYNMGVRYKTFQYLLGSLEEKGDYNPLFIDYQGFFTYALSKKTELGFLGTASMNSYQYVPTTRVTTTGIWNDQNKLTINYKGQEIDRFQTITGSFYLQFDPTRNAYFKFIASAFNTDEQETFDIIGAYLLNKVENAGTVEQDDSSMNIGIGSYHEHGRNFFNATVAGLSHRGGVKAGNHFLQWGLDFKHEIISDKMNEWESRDSAGYSLPYSNKEVKLYYVAKPDDNQHQGQRYMGFMQNTTRLTTNIGELLITGGVRAHYWSYTDKITISPRISASLQTGVKHDIIPRISLGWYHQPPFYREIKDLYGNVNPNIQTPYSIHAVAGLDYSFVAWERPFKLTFETYYKWLRDLIPYQIENVRVRYLSNLISNGYAYGADFKVNGEFVSGTQSWVSMSLMKTEEDIPGDYKRIDDGKNIVSVGYIPRPSDQRFKFSMFFQDYMPGLPHYQMNLTGHFITGAPYGLPRSERHTQIARIESYRRVDIGFTRLLVTNSKNLTKINFLNRLESADISLEVFNIMDIKNTSSYFFITDIYNNFHSIPNRLTGITFNLKLSATF